MGASPVAGALPHGTIPEPAAASQGHLAGKRVASGPPALWAPSSHPPWGLRPHGLSGLPPGFWGLNLRPDYAWTSNASNAQEATPVGLVRWPGGGYTDRYDPLANGGLGAIHNDDGTTTLPRFTTAQFLSLCENESFQVIFSLPAEINSTSQIRAEVSYVEGTLGFHPTYWEIGNEPALWTHFNVPWSSWTTSQNLRPTFAQYTQLVTADVAAVRSIDPSTPIIGLGGVGSGTTSETDWINATLRAPGVDAVAIHVYPVGAGYPGESLTGFFAGLDSSSSLLWRIPRDEAAIASSCPTCHVALLVSEVGAATGTTLSAYMSGFPMVPFISAEVVQGISEGMATLVYWVFQGSYPGAWFPPSGGPPSEIFEAYTDLFPLISRQNLTVGPTTTPATGAYTLVGVNASTVSLFAVNANATQPLALNFSQAGIYVGSGPGSALTWNSSTPAPILDLFPSHLPATWTLPPMSVGLFRVATAPPPPPALALTTSVYPTSGVAPLDVAFSATPSGGTPPYTVRWTFGDGSPPSGSATPQHVYNATGLFTAQVSVLDAAGASVARSFSVNVLSTVPPLLAHLQVGPTTGPAPLLVRANGSSSGGRPPYLYDWNFGDGSPDGLVQNVSHTYVLPGAYTVTLLVTDSSGSEGAASAQVEVLSPLLVQISANPTSGAAPLGVSFHGVVTGGSPPYSYAWSFGDGSAASGPWENHTYAAPGTFGVILTVLDARGLVARANASVFVVRAPGANGTAGTGGTPWYEDTFFGLPLDLLLPLLALAVAALTIVGGRRRSRAGEGGPPAGTSPPASSSQEDGPVDRGGQDRGHMVSR